MTHNEVILLEAEFGVHFPSSYRRALTDLHPFTSPTRELDSDPVSLKLSNTAFRKTAPYGFPWQPAYWCIGDDGAGGFYFVNTSQDDSTVFYCDHEDMPESMDDEERLGVRPFAEFIQEVLYRKEQMRQWEEEMKSRVANRRWWQFWIPRQWPPKRNG